MPTGIGAWFTIHGMSVFSRLKSACSFLECSAIAFMWGLFLNIHSKIPFSFPIFLHSSSDTSSFLATSSRKNTSLLHQNQRIWNRTLHCFTCLDRHHSYFIFLFWHLLDRSRYWRTFLPYLSCSKYRDYDGAITFPVFQYERNGWAWKRPFLDPASSSPLSILYHATW